MDHAVTVAGPVGGYWRPFPYSTVTTRTVLLRGRTFIFTAKKRSGAHCTGVSTIEYRESVTMKTEISGRDIGAQYSTY
jgi:hypothetical protein